MSYDFDFEQPSAGGGGGGLVRGGDFSLNRSSGEPLVTTVIKKTSPNLLLWAGIVGAVAIAVTTIYGQWSVNSIELAKAETKKIEAQAKATQVEVQAQAKLMNKLADASSQRPVCLAFVCKFGETPVDQPAAAQAQADQSQPLQEALWGEQQPIEQQQAAVVQATDPKTPDFWYAQMHDQNYINQWTQFCSPNWGVSPECQALYQAMKTNI